MTKVRVFHPMTFCNECGCYYESFCLEHSAPTIEERKQSAWQEYLSKEVGCKTYEESAENIFIYYNSIA